MEIFEILTSNYFINVCFVSWFSAQIAKTFLEYCVTKKFVAERLIGAGGMPSSHSALVCSLAVAMSRKLGFDSPEFALSFAFAGIVMYDAMGVRRAAGEQAKVLNKMIFGFFKTVEGEDQEDPDMEAVSDDMPDKALKEYIGHTPLEVLGGALLGILVAMFMPIF
ncbi:MAG: divergent PAP2 family protein [Oscillospiraceae bacterium]